MRIRSTRVLHGPSRISDTTVARHRLGGLERWPGDHRTPELVERLAERLPGLPADWEACSARTQQEGGGPGHLLEHLCIELQRQAGCELCCVRADALARVARDEAFVPFEDPRVEREAAQLAADLLRELLVPVAGPEAAAPEGPPYRREPLDPDARIQALLRLARRELLPVQDRELARRARARGVPVFQLAGRVLQLGQGRYQQRLSATKTSRTNVVSNDLAANKDYGRRVLRDLGLPVPAYERVYRRRDALEAARKIGYPVVVKPNNGSMGRGVSVDVRDPRELRRAYALARETDRSVLVEELVEGFDYRLLVVDGRLLAASKRVPGHVVGDGQSSVEQLVELVNLDPRRGSGPRRAWTRLELDERAERLLARHGHTRESVPERGELVYLRRNANTSDGGTAVDVTDEVHPDNRVIAERTARAIGLDIAGVDVLTRDISEPLFETGGRICEINSRPGLRKHLWPAEGKPRDVLAPVLSMLFPPGRPCRVPVVAVSGTGSTRRVARTLANLLASRGHVVGLAAGRRVSIAGQHTGHANLRGPSAARAVLLDPDVEVAVLELRPSDVLRHGLGCDRIDVALIVQPASTGSPAEPIRVGDPAETRAGRDVVEALGVVARATRSCLLVSGEPELGRVLATAAVHATLRPLAFPEPAEAGDAATAPRSRALARAAADALCAILEARRPAA